MPSSLSLSLATRLVCPFGICIDTENSLLFLGGSGQNSVDLSRATKLKDVTFRIDSSGPEWVTTALRTITPNHRDLLQISISAAYYPTIVMFNTDDVIQGAEGQTTRRWLELDQLLAQLWESHSIPLKILCRAPSWKEKSAHESMGLLLPEITRGGTVNLFNA